MLENVQYNIKLFTPSLAQPAKHLLHSPVTAGAGKDPQHHPVH